MFEIEGVPSTLFFVEKPRYDFFCVPNVVYLYDHQMSIAKHFSMDSVKSQFETMEKIEF